jgi:dTDP-4-amino-4,6-dideoxygalactose transaminase
VTSLGINAKMSELSAAVGLTSLDNMATIVAVNRQNCNAYRRCLRSLPGLKLLAYDAAESSNH